MRIALIYGGRNCEHEVSLRSASNVRKSLLEAGHEVWDIEISQSGQWQLTNDTTRSIPGLETDLLERNSTLLPKSSSQLALWKADVVFPLVHGPKGEDGSLQGLLEMANVPYVGCGVLGSALAMDKDVAKRLLREAGIPVTRHRSLRNAVHFGNEEHSLDSVSLEIGFPAFVKPANLGSSVGISRTENRSELIKAVRKAFQYDEKIMVEESVPHAREFEVSVLGWHELQASIPGEIRLGTGFYDYAAKYTNDSAELLIPAPLAAKTVAKLQEMAILAFRTLEGCGMGRVDFLMNSRTNELFINEINTVPGFTSISMYPKLWEASGLSKVQLMQRLVDIALEHHAAKQNLRTAYL